MKSRIVLVLVGSMVLIIVIVGGIVVYQQQQRPRPEQRIAAWASAAEANDASRMRALMEPNEFVFATWRERWMGIRQTLQVQPGHAISGIEQRGDTTAATVHFRTAGGAVCVPILLDQAGNIAIAGTHYTCAFPPPETQP